MVKVVLVISLANQILNRKARTRQPGIVDCFVMLARLKHMSRVKRKTVIHCQTGQMGCFLLHTSSSKAACVRAETCLSVVNKHRNPLTQKNVQCLDSVIQWIQQDVTFAHSKDFSVTL